MAVDYDVANRLVLIEGFWIEERAWRSAKGGDAIRCYGGPDAPGARGRGGDDIIERAHRRRGWGAVALLNPAKDWWVSHGLEFVVPCKSSLVGRLFYLAGMFLRNLLLEKRYAYTG